jgi:hypothetical protein
MINIFLKPRLLLLCTGTMIPGNIEREEDEKAEQQTTGSRE